MSERDADVPAIYVQWLTWVSASPEHEKAFREDPVGSVRAAGLEADPKELARLLEAITYVTRRRGGHGSR